MSVLKLYFMLLGVAVKDDAREFLSQLGEFVKKSVVKAMDPEKYFDFSEINVIRVRRLLHKLKGEQIVANTSSSKLLNLIASTVLEALQYIRVIPNPLEAKLASIGKEIQKCHKFNKLSKHLATIIKCN